MRTGKGKEKEFLKNKFKSRSGSEHLVLSLKFTLILFFFQKSLP